ncbi:MAG: transglycosylase SLT domain-containing protein [Anaerolineae bacterium]|nr:transglycosylase SLT domain-containing protein [Anaerolineae bacterium]
MWLEILFFVALAVFGFSVVAQLLGSASETILHFPSLPYSEEDADVATSRLYEAASRRPAPEPTLSPIFMPSVQYWKDDLLKWSADYAIDPNLAATVMQIESCGGPEAMSSVGATSLFQVMPFHFEEGEDPFDPDTNAKRGLAFLAGGLELSNGHAGLALAGYNGGYGVISRDYEDWPHETQSYYRWGSGIYREASAGWDSSPTLVAWLAAGGKSLCDAAEEELGLTSVSR